MVDMKQNDLLPVLEITIRKIDGTPLNLTDATAKFIMADAKTKTVKINEPATIKEPPSGGVVEYAWAEGDTDTPGDYHAEVEITYSDGKIITAPSSGYILVSVHKELA